MPDSFPFPQWGQQSFDDRYLDSLLAGNASDIPDALRPVADTLNALRAAPSARELHGESDARAQFRAQFHGTQPQGTVPLGAVPGQGNPISGEIPAVPLKRDDRKRSGRGPREPARRGVGVRFAGLMAAAAVIVLGAAVTYTGHLPGPMQQLAHDTIAAPPPKLAGGPATGSGVQATSARPVPVGTTPLATGGTPAGAAPQTPGAQNRRALCNAFWTDLEHPRPGPQPWQTPRYKQLITASGSERNVFDYCYPVWDPQDAGQYPTLPAYPPYFPRQWGSGNHRGNGQQGNGNQNGNGRAPSSGSQDSGSAGSGNGSASTPTASASSTPPPSPQTSADSGAVQQHQQGQSTGS